MKRALLIAFLFCLPLASVAEAELIRVQDWEISGGSKWGFTASPSAYSSATSNWDGTTGVGSITAASGSGFWGMQNLVGPSGMGGGDHTLSFDALDVSGFTGVSISFDYNAEHFLAGDYISVQLVQDGMVSAPVNIFSGGFMGTGTGGWNSYNIAIADSVDDVGLILTTNLDSSGTSGAGGFDNVSLTGIPEASSLLYAGVLVIGMAAGGMRRRRKKA